MANVQTGNTERSIIELEHSVPEPPGFNAVAPECLVTLKALARRIGLRVDATRVPMQGLESQGAGRQMLPQTLNSRHTAGVSLLRAKRS